MAPLKLQTLGFATTCCQVEGALSDGRLEVSVLSETHKASPGGLGKLLTGLGETLSPVLDCDGCESGDPCDQTCFGMVWSGLPLVSKFTQALQAHCDSEVVTKFTIEDTHFGWTLLGEWDGRAVVFRTTGTNPVDHERFGRIVNALDQLDSVREVRDSIQHGDRPKIAIRVTPYTAPRNLLELIMQLANAAWSAATEKA